VKRFFHTAFLQVAVFFVAIYCVFSHFGYLKMRAKGRLSRWFSVPEWKILREDKDGHELGSTEQYVLFPWRWLFRTHALSLAARIYEPVEAHRRAAFNALMKRKYGVDARNRSQSPPPSGTSRGDSPERMGMDTTQENMGRTLTVPPETDPETRAAIQKFVELICEIGMARDVGVPGEPCASPLIRTQQAGPSRISASPFSQYSINPGSPEPSDRNSVPVTTCSKTKEPPSPSLQPSRKTRSFKTSAHSQGETIWMTTASYEELPNPPEPVPEDEPGVLYIHRNLSNDRLQVWLLGNEEWATVQLSAKTQHPTFRDRYLAIRLDGTPSWVTLASWYTAKKRVNSQ